MDTEVLIEGLLFLAIALACVLAISLVPVEKAAHRERLRQSAIACNELRADGGSCLEGGVH